MLTLLKYKSGGGMAENTLNSTNTGAKSNESNGAAKSKRPPRKALNNVTSANSTRAELTIKGKISSTAKSVASSDFPLFKTFVLSPEADELFIKTTKNSIISLSTGDKFASNVTGYLVIL